MSNPHTSSAALRPGWLPSSGKQELSSPSPGMEGSRKDGSYRVTSPISSQLVEKSHLMGILLTFSGPCLSAHRGLS